MKPNHLLKVSNFKLGKVFSLLLFCFAAAILSGSLTYQVQAVGISPPRVNIQTKVGVQTPITVRLIRSQGQDGNINMVVDLDGDMKEAFIGEPRFTIPSDVDIYEYTFHLKPIHYKESRQKLNVIFITDSIDVSGQLSDDDGGHAVSISTGVVVTTLFYVNPGDQVVPTPPVIEPEPVADDEIEKEEEVIEEEEEEEEKEKEEIKEEDVIEEEEEKEAEEEIQEIKEDKIEEVQKIKEIKELTELEKRQERLMALREARQNEESPIFVTLEQVDFSGDGKIDASDVSTMAAAFTADYNPGFYLDGDGKVGTRDLSVLLSNWTAEVPKKKKKPPVPPGPPLKEDKVVLHTIADDKGSGLFVAASLSFMDRRNTFKTYVMLDTGVSAANASEMDFFYDSEVMTLIGMDIDSSVFTVWA